MTVDFWSRGRDRTGAALHFLSRYKPSSLGHFPHGNTDMNFSTAASRWMRLVRSLQLGLLLAAFATNCGCNYFIMLGYLVGGPPSVEADYEKMTKKSLTDKGVKVAVVCFAPDEIRLNYIDVDKEIAKYVAHRLVKHNIKVVHPDRVQDWLDKHEDWDRPEEIAEATGATHIIFIDVHKYNLFEENSHELYRGRCEVLVSVFEMQKDGGDADKIYTKEKTSTYPLEVARPQSEISYDMFRRQYLARLSEEIGRFFYEYFNGDDISDVF